ncbi:MAG: hypothetical protein PVI36_13115 [Desulfobacterales bacterium]|jgi:hypothetical protein
MHFYRSTATRRRFLRLFLLGLAAVMLLSCSTDEQSPDYSRSQTEGITFFDVGAETVFSDALRDRLRKSLGPDAIAYRSTIDLEFNARGFLQREFPILHDLNQRLNTPAGERVEHDTVKLMYRYAVKENLPFSYVELVFSNFNGKPLFIQVRSRDLSDIIRTLEAKYGSPQAIDQSTDEGRFFFWSEDQDVLLVSIIPTWRGDKEYQLVIYYVDNLEKLIAVEEKERRQKEEEKRRAGEKIF